MEPAKPETLTTTLLADNIHCPSCVSYAEDVLRPLSDVSEANIRLISQEISFKHCSPETGALVVQQLRSAAFDISHVRTEAAGKVVSDHSTSSARSRLFFQRSSSRARQKHIANCKSCQELPQLSHRFGLWTFFQRRKVQPDPERAIASPRIPVPESDRIPDDSFGESHSYVASVSISGMTCASCSSSISKELEALPYVTHVEISAMTHSGVITYQGDEDNVGAILQKIDDTGYGATLNEVRSQSRDATPEEYVASLSIGGMTCGSCVGAIVTGLEELPYVHSVDVDLVGGSGLIKFEGKENIDEIIEKIDDLGYDAALVELKSQREKASVDVSAERLVTLQIDGMFCEHCPGNLVDFLKEEFGDAIIIERAPTLDNSRVHIRYTPSPPHLTIRKLVDAVSKGHEAFSAIVWHPPSMEQRSRTIQHSEQRRILLRLIFTFLVAIPTLVIGVIYMSLMPASDPTRMWFEEPIWVGSVSRTEWALFIMTTPVMFFGADIFHVRAFKELRAMYRPGSKATWRRRLYRFGSMNLLISAGTSVAYVASVAVLIMDARTPHQDGMIGQSSTYFDSVTFLSFFILIGKFLEAYSKAKTGDVVAMLNKLRPDDALLVESSMENGSPGNNSEQVRRMPVDFLEIGDKVRVLHGASPPSDGIVTSTGTFLFDESSLSGEAKAVKKVAGDQVFAGSVNVSQPVEIEVTRIGGTSMLDNIVAVVREGLTKRAPVERFADTVTSYFVPVITALAISTFLIWLALGESGALPLRYLGNSARGGWAFWSLEFAIAVFVVACPCGLGLAAPTALFVGGGLAAKHGILVRGGGEAFQEASRLDAIVFDKTGTLTEGKMQVVKLKPLEHWNDDLNLILALAKILEESSIHPIARAVVEYCESHSEGAMSVTSSNFQEIPGQGLRGSFTVRIDEKQEEQTYQAAIGNERLLATLHDEKEKPSSPELYLQSLLTKYQTQGHSTAILYLSGPSTSTPTVSQHTFHPAALFAISDPIRPSTPALLTALRTQHNLEIYMCTGDNPITAHAIAAQLAIPPTHVRASVLPTDKANFIHTLQTSSDHPRRRVIAFVGDGTNDTPALTAADVSIALSSGSDIAVSSASFILLNPDLAAILTLVGLARRVFARVRWNFVWATLYNVLLVPVAAGVLFRLGDLDGRGTGWRLGPVWAAAAMAGSSVSVVLSSLALRLPEVKLGRWGGTGGKAVGRWKWWCRERVGGLRKDVGEVVDDEGRSLHLSWV